MTYLPHTYCLGLLILSGFVVSLVASASCAEVLTGNGHDSVTITMIRVV